VSINRHPPVHCWTEVEDSPYTGGPIGLATELRNREKVLGTTIDSRRDMGCVQSANGSNGTDDSC
jgi:hypothetical protein